jgi:transcriptional regulator with XRE-family HTH domain
MNKVFSRWLDASGITYAEAARLLGLDGSTIGKYARGAQRPRAYVIRRMIAEKTKGAVPSESWGDAYPYDAEARKRIAPKKKTANPASK